MKDTGYLAPGIHGPSLRWYELDGLMALIARSLWRFWITGRPLLGKGDNATFLRDATVDYRGGPVEKLTRARWRRVTWRWAVAGVPMLLVDASPWITWWPLIGYVTVATGGGGWLTVRAFRAWWPVREVRREFVVPTWQVVCKVLGERYSHRVAVRSVQLPAGFGTEDMDDELIVRINLPAVPLDEGMKRRIAVSAGERLGIADVAAAWMVKGAHAYVDLSPRKFPPAKLTYAEVRQQILDASPSRPFVGLAAGREPVHLDLDNDGPHVGASGGTGTGKSSLLRVFLARRVQAGHGLVVCDYKVTSHTWARRIAQEDPARVIYLTDEPEIAEGIEAVFAEFSRRREVLKTDASALDEFRPIDLVVEEVNTLSDMLRTWWGHERRRILAEAKDHGEPVPYVPAVPECVTALAALVQMGRELRIHVHFAAQRLDASAIAPRGGGAVRESITNRLLAKYSLQAWKMLCGQVKFQVFPGGPRGIWTLVIGDEVTHFRVPFMSVDDAYDLAMSGPAPLGPVLGRATLVTEYRRAVVRAVTLGEAWEQIPGCPSLDALRKNVQRAEVPALGRRGNAYTYDLAELERLYAMS